jgi:hypothetical protein
LAISAEIDDPLGSKGQPAPARKWQSRVSFFGGRGYFIGNNWAIMRYLVLGAGALGGLFGGRLLKAGAD